MPTGYTCDVAAGPLTDTYCPCIALCTGDKLCTTPLAARTNHPSSLKAPFLEFRSSVHLFISVRLGARTKRVAKWLDGVAAREKKKRPLHRQVELTGISAQGRVETPQTSDHHHNRFSYLSAVAALCFPLGILSPGSSRARTHVRTSRLSHTLH